MNNKTLKVLLLAFIVQLPIQSENVASSEVLARTAAAPSPDGKSDGLANPYAVHDFEWRDEARLRDVPARLYLPAAASADHPVPLVVFSHGIGGSRFGYSYLGKFWAGRGYASLHLQHVGSDRSLWTGNPLTLTLRLHDAAQDGEAIARARDHRFALDQLLAETRLGSSIDPARIVAAGHSYGANTTMLVSGAKVVRNGETLSFLDPRIKAAILLSAPPFYGEQDNRRILGDVHLPSLHVTATEDVIRVPGYFSAAEDRIAIYDSMGEANGAGKTLVVFSGGSHSIFTDRGGTGGIALNPLVKDATCELSLAFIQRVLDGDEHALLMWPQRFASLVTRFETRH